jgi:L-lactate dehydrogenase
VSIRLRDYFGISDVCLSVPAVIGAGGVRRVLRPRLSQQELEQLRSAAQVVAAETRRAGKQLAADEP